MHPILQQMLVQNLQDLELVATLLAHGFDATLRALVPIAVVAPIIIVALDLMGSWRRRRALLNRLIHTTFAAGLLLVAGCGAKNEVRFVAGRAEDEAAIREIVNEGMSTHSYADDVDWENAFGGRFQAREPLERFLAAVVLPTFENAELEGTRLTVRFLGSDLALADAYWRVAGQTDPADPGTVDRTRVGRATLWLARSSNEWRIQVVRIADFPRSEPPTLTIDADNPWPSVKLAADQLTLYEGDYQEAGFEGMIGIPIHVWVEQGVLHTETISGDVRAMVPMGDHRFVLGRYADGEPVEIYWPEQVQVFLVEEGRVVGYRVFDGDREMISARRIERQ